MGEKFLEMGMVISLKWILSEEISELRKKITKLGWVVEDMYMKTTTAFKNRDQDLAYNLVDEFWDIYNLYIEIFDYIQTIFGTFTLRDYELRFLTGSLVVSENLMNIARECQNMNELIIQMTKEPELYQNALLPNMMVSAQKLLRKALRMYIDENLEGSVHSCEQALELEILYEKFRNDLSEYIKLNPKVLKRGLILMDIAKSVVSTADDSIEIMENSFYILTGEHKKCNKGKFEPVEFEKMRRRKY